MPDKQKVTLYIPDELHRQFKIRSAVDGETMSRMAQRAIEFYLNHADVVQAGVESYGVAHQVHSCPQCSAAVTVRNNSLTLVRAYGDCVADDMADLERMPKLGDQIGDKKLSNQLSDQAVAKEASGEGELITC